MSLVQNRVGDRLEEVSVWEDKKDSDVEEKKQELWDERRR